MFMTLNGMNGGREGKKEKVLEEEKEAACVEGFFLSWRLVGVTQREEPNQQRRYAKWKLSRNMYTLHKRFSTFGTDLYAQSVLINNISASDLSRKLIKGALLVGRKGEAREGGRQK